MFRMPTTTVPQLDIICSTNEAGNAGNSINVSLNTLGANKKMTKEVKKTVQNSLMIPALIYRSETWNWQ